MLKMGWNSALYYYEWSKMLSAEHFLSAMTKFRFNCKLGCRLPPWQTKSYGYSELATSSVLINMLSYCFLYILIHVTWKSTAANVIALYNSSGMIWVRPVDIVLCDENFSPLPVHKASDTKKKLAGPYLSEYQGWHRCDNTRGWPARKGPVRPWG